MAHGVYESMNVIEIVQNNNGGMNPFLQRAYRNIFTQQSNVISYALKVSEENTEIMRERGTAHHEKFLLYAMFSEDLF